MNVAELGVAGQIAWFELLADSAAGMAWAHGSRMAVVTGIASNADNGIVLDRAALNDEAALRHLIHQVLEADVPASLVLTEPVPTPELAPLFELGLSPENSATQMTMSLSTATAPILPEGVKIEVVTDGTLLRRGLRALGEDWFDEHELEQRAQCYEHVGLGLGHRVRHWVALRNEVVIGMATSFRFDEIVELAHCGVLASERRKGVATALTAVRLSSAMQDGAIHAVLSPSPDGHRLHQTLGFESTPVPRDRWFYLPVAQPQKV